MRNRWLVVALLGLACAAPGLALSGLPLLRAATGARSAALAGAVVALPGADVLTANPAAFAPPASRSLGLSHSEWIQGTRQEYLDLGAARAEQAWGLAALLWQTRDLERRTGPSLEPLGRFGVYEAAVAVVHSRAWTDRLRLGAAGKLLRQSIYTETATGAAADVGVLFRLRPGLDLGAAASNLGRMSALDQEATPLPLTLRLGAACAPGRRLLLSGQLQRADGDHSAHLGVECEAVSGLLLRAGYQSVDTCPLTLGLGVRAHGWVLDYAFLPFGQDLGEAHRLSLRLER